jgi:hypothetical protein
MQMSNSESAVRGLRAHERETLRAFLVSQTAFERTQRLRHDLFLVLAPASAAIWVLAMWPRAVSPRVGSALLGAWWLLFVAAIAVSFVERMWLRRSQHAREGLSAGAAQTSKHAGDIDGCFGDGRGEQ